MNLLEFNECLKNAENNACNLEKLYKNYYPKIVIHIKHKFGREISEDVAQEFFKRLLDGQYSQNFVFSPAPWIYRCCDNIALNILKHQSREAATENINVFREDLFLKFEKHEELVEILKVLNKEELKLFYLYRFEGYSLKEIAPMLNMTYDSLKQKNSRIMKKLKNFQNDAHYLTF